MILVAGVMTIGIAGGALFLAAAFALILVRTLERTDLADPHEDEFSVKGEPKWWPQFEREFADYVDS